MHETEFDRILDECVDRLACGSTVAECIAAYPEHAERLTPLLRVTVHTLEAGRDVPSLEAMRHARRRFHRSRAQRAAARTAQPRPTLLERLVARPLSAAAVATVGVIALTMLLVVIPLAPGGDTVPSIEPAGPTTTPSSPFTPTSPTTPTTTPAEPGDPIDPTLEPDVIVATSDPSGNFVFLLSDAPNDIGDFSSLEVTIDSIDLKPLGNGRWVRITGINPAADLVQVQGDLAFELWRGEIPDGDYSAVFLNITHIEGTLVDSRGPVEVTLPSERLHVNTNFTVGGGTPTEFVFDITVHRAGWSGNISRYVLSPQASESGVGRSVRVIQSDSPAKNPPDRGTTTTDTTTPGNGEERDHEAPQPSPGPGPSPDRVNAVLARTDVLYHLSDLAT